MVASVSGSKGCYVMKERKHIVVVGLGSIGRRHVRLLVAREDAEVSVCDTTRKAIEWAKHETDVHHIYNNFESAIAANPDMMLIATPPQLHADMAIEALKNGIHVLCEKPISNQLSDAQRMVNASDRYEPVLNIGFHLHFHPVLLRLKELVSAGSLGRIASLHARIGTYQTLLNSQSGYQQAEEGTLLLDYAHQPDSFFWLLNSKPLGVYMSASQVVGIDPTANPNSATIVCDYQEAYTSSMILNYLQHPECADYEIVGSEGWAQANLNTGQILIGNRRTAAIRQETKIIERDSIYMAEHQAFIDAVNGVRPPESPACDAYASAEVIEGAMQSWKTKARIELCK